MKLKISDIGMGLITAQNENILLAGGFRSGNSSAGVTRRKYMIYDKIRWNELEKIDGITANEAQDKSLVGFVELFVRDGKEDIFDVVGLVNIEINKEERRNGYARKTMDGIRHHTGNELEIHDIKKHYAATWRKLGVTLFHNGHGQPVQVSKSTGFIAGRMPPIDQAPEMSKKTQESSMDM